jgi:N-terminal acetyltransferase B complex catalytic subunit
VPNQISLLDMSTTRRFRPSDLFLFNQVNLDKLTETYNLHFYFSYMLQWPELQQTVSSPSGDLMAYIIAKAEGERTEWHGHVSAVTVGPCFRRLGLASKLMSFCEDMSQDTYDCYFVDLFVRKSNTIAINMYYAFGYIVHRTILNYYSGNEDAYDMRKSLARDKDKRAMIAMDQPVRSDEASMTL